MFNNFEVALPHTTHKKVRVSFAQSRQPSTEAFTSSKKLTQSVSIYYELVGISIQYAATYYF
jgi:hypothetical protein